MAEDTALAGSRLEAAAGGAATRGDERELDGGRGLEPLARRVERATARAEAGREAEEDMGETAKLAE